MTYKTEREYKEENCGKESTEGTLTPKGRCLVQEGASEEDSYNLRRALYGLPHPDKEEG